MWLLLEVGASMPLRGPVRGVVIATRYGEDMSAVNQADQPTLAQHHPMGASTGVFEDLRGSWQELVAAACEVSTYAVELSALSERELPGLISYLAGKPRLPFSYVSVHAPVKGRNLDDWRSARVLSELPAWVRSIVTHPDALAELAPYRELESRFVLENMDDRKQTGRTADELDVAFDQLPEAGFCFDIAHAASIDPTMHVAEELLDRFRSRLRQVHLSSLHHGHHIPVTDDDEARFAGILARCRDVPWILEAEAPERWRGDLAATRLVGVGEASAP
jgi:xylose isomerase-like TIM barrel protein